MHTNTLRFCSTGLFSAVIYTGLDPLKDNLWDYGSHFYMPFDIAVSKHKGNSRDSMH